MKDEEMAEEWVDKEISLGTSMYNPHIEYYCRQAFLAGLKAGRPQWHDDPNDLPKKIENESKISQDVWLYIKNWGREVGYYDYRKNYWVVRCRQVNLPIIAWCEIPTFDKE